MKIGRDGRSVVPHDVIVQMVYSFHPIKKEQQSNQWGLFINISHAKRWGTPKARETWSAQYMQWNECSLFLPLKVLSLFRLQGLTNTLHFSELSPNLTFPSKVQKLCCSWLHEQKGTASSWGRPGGWWSSSDFAGWVPPKPVNCVPKWDFSMDYEGLCQWQEVGPSKAGAGHQGSSRNLPLDLCVCSVQVCGLASVWNFRFGDIPQAQVFFSGFFFTRKALERSTPSSLGFTTVSTEKFSSLAHGEVTRGLEGKADIDARCGCRANDVSINVDSVTTVYFYPQKKFAWSHHREKERKRERK